VQDAWSSIDHKIKYKKNIPHNLKRRINRLAALFELADQEFVIIRNETVTLEQSATMAPQTVRAPIMVEPTPIPEKLTPFSFLRVVTSEFPSYHFHSFKIDGFVEDLIEVNSNITDEELKTALSESREKVEQYKDYQREKYLNRMNPYTIIRHALYLSDKDVYRAILFELQRTNFDKWLGNEHAC